MTVKGIIAHTILGHDAEIFRGMADDERYVSACSCGWRSLTTGSYEIAETAMENHINVKAQIENHKRRYA